MIEWNITCCQRQGNTTLKVTPQEMEDYKRGRHVQDAFPNLDAGQRELIISRTCEKCFDDMFK